MLKVITVPNKILNIRTKSISSIDKKITDLVKEMEETLISAKEPEGVGLSAPQVGILLSLFLIRKTSNAKPTAFINPKILKRTGIRKQKKGKNKIELEGCLSIPKIWGQINRHDKILLSYQTIKGIQKKEWFSGLVSSSIQHEDDHLHGILFTQRAIEQNNDLYEERNGKLIKVEY